MGNSFCKKCYIDDDDYGDLFTYNSSNNLYYTDIKADIKADINSDDKYKYKTSPGPPIIIRNKEAYLNVLRII